MNAITPTPRRRGPLSPPVPNAIPTQWTDRLQTAWTLGPHPIAVKRQAEHALEQIAPYAEPVTDQMVRDWIAPVLASISNPKPKAEAAAWFHALMIAVGTLPAGAFTADTQRECVRRCTHWPSAAEVYQVVAPAAWAIRNDVSALRRVIAAPIKTEDNQ